jgi:ABC-type dipeptide/oligopeptide/nickel transport system permease subunit
VYLSLAALQAVWVARIVRGELLAVDDERRCLDLVAVPGGRRVEHRVTWRGVAACLPLCGALSFAEVCGVDAALAMSGLGSLLDAPTWGRALAEAFVSFRTAHLVPTALIVLTTLALYAVLGALPSLVSARATPLRAPRRVATRSPWPSSQ